jgi:hypothetical protein
MADKLKTPSEHMYIEILVISVDGQIHEIILMIINMTGMNSIKMNKNVV